MENIRIITKRCMETDKKPLISILMAVYEPRMDWLREQLESLNIQTYPNLRLYVRDDCSPTVPLEDVKALVDECITAFPYTIEQNEENLGSNLTFERLTKEAEGEYFAYCDQDDVWLPEKLTVLQEIIEKERAELVCSDMYIIDGNGKQVADSITKVRKHHHLKTGSNLASELLTSNFVTGCTMMIHSDLAKEAIPFCPHMVHDHYLALYSATKGKIFSIRRPLIQYRIHGNNQTEMMAGVKDKESYLRIRIIELIKRFEWLKDRFSTERELLPEIRAAIRWANARKNNFEGNKKAKKIVFDYRRFSPLTSLFEIAFSGAPTGLFMFFIGLKRRNIV